VLAQYILDLPTACVTPDFHLGFYGPGFCCLIYYCLVVTLNVCHELWQIIIYLGYVLGI